MSVENVKKYLAENGFEREVIEFEAETATVALAAEAIGCEEKRIAKTLSFDTAEGVALIVMSGEAKVDNKRFKEEFLEKAKMIAFDEVEEKTGHAPGGVCPFAVKEGVKVYADVSLKRFDYFYPAAGSSHSAVKMTCDELFRLGRVERWVDVAKGWRENE
ncbi:MAG: YbaK/EbsC family protein [Clostridia bacterium]|nr:YbaK/EbsC family protein [Clostridia bacterium]